MVEQIKEEEQIKQIKEQEEAFNYLFNKRITEMLNKDFFLLSKEDMKKIIEFEFEYPDYNTKELNFLLNKMAFTKDPLIIKGKKEEQDWKISWDVMYFTSPTQLKIIFRDYIKDYPQLILNYNYVSETGRAIMGNTKISIGQCVSLLRNYNSSFINNKENKETKDWNKQYNLLTEKILDSLYKLQNNINRSIPVKDLVKEKIDYYTKIQEGIITEII